LEINSQKELWRTKVESNRNAYSSSPILADGHIFITREDGATFVIDAVDESTVATPVFVDGTILIRTYDNLYCIGKS
jgi:outer membrane protein assembly factor BamB